MAPRSGARRGLIQGFGLIEVMISVSILTVLAMGTMLVIVPISRQARVSRELGAAKAEASSILEKIQSTPFSDILALYPDGTELTVNGLYNGLATVTYENPLADPLNVQLTLTWTSPDLGSMSRTFITVRTE